MNIITIKKQDFLPKLDLGSDSWLNPLKKYVLFFISIDVLMLKAYR